MYELFDIKGRGAKLVGYHFPCENAKKVVVLIHGIGEYDGRYTRVAGYFKEAGIAMVGMDLRGHGRSEGVRGNCAPRTEVLKDIDTLIEEAQKLYPNTPVVLYGHSMGGGIVADYRARGEKNDVPVGYLISAPWIKLVRSVPDALVGIVGFFGKIFKNAQMKSECEEADLGNPEFVCPYKADEFVHPYITLRTAYEGFSIGNSLAAGNNETNGKADNIPTLIMHGTEDKICNIQGTREYVSHLNKDTVTFIEWEGYYHEIHNGGGKGQTGEEPIKAAIEFINSL